MVATRSLILPDRKIRFVLTSMTNRVTYGLFHGKNLSSIDDRLSTLGHLCKSGMSVAADEGTTFAGQREPPITRAAGREQRHANGFQKGALSFDGFRPFPQCDSFSAPVRRPHHLHPHSLSLRANLARESGSLLNRDRHSRSSDAAHLYTYRAPLPRPA